MEVFGYVLFKQTYLPAATLTPLVLLAYLIASPTEFSKAALTKSGDTKVLLNAVLLSLLINLALLSLVILFPPSDTMLTLQLAASATVAAYLFNVTYFYRKSRAIDKTPYPIGRFLFVVMIAAASVFFNEVWLYEFPGWQRLLICITILFFLSFIGLQPILKNRKK
jgi:O-antigen/teichoic acid export membrane protein